MFNDRILLLTVLMTLAIAGTILLWIITLRKQRRLIKSEQALKRETLKESMLRELTRRIGYTFDVNEIIEVISGSLHEIVRYKTVSYLLFDEEKRQLKLKIDLDSPVGQAFLDQVKNFLLNGFSALSEKQLGSIPLKEEVVGAIRSDSPDGVASFFNLPLIIGGKPVGLINIASTEEGLYRGAETEILYSLTAIASQTVFKLSQVIAHEERRLNSLVGSLPDGLIMIDADERVIVANESSKKFLGFKDDETVSLALISEKLGKKNDIHWMIEKSIKVKERSLLEELRTPAGVYGLVVYPVMDLTGEVYGSAITLRDIGPEKALEKMREEYVATMVHELRSPLTNIRWTIEEVIDETPDEKKEIKGSLRDVETSVHNLLSLVNDLLDSVKIEQGKLTVSPQPGDLAEVVAGRLREFSAQAQQKKIELISQIPGKLKVIPFDATRINQVLNNFMSNALKFTASGSITVKVEEDEARQVTRVSVIDTGPGISEDDKKKLFQKFVQVGSDEAKHKGTGLGLVIAKGITEAHGGRVGVESKLGQGSTFWLELPQKIT